MTILKNFNIFLSILHQKLADRISRIFYARSILRTPKSHAESYASSLKAPSTPAWAHQVQEYSGTREDQTVDVADKLDWFAVDFCIPCR